MNEAKRDSLKVLTDDWRSRTAVKAANWILRTFAPDYAKFTAGVIEYGMCAAAADAKAGHPSPSDWRDIPVSKDGADKNGNPLSAADLLKGEKS